MEFNVLMSNILISIVVTTYNSSSYIVNTLDSLTAQTFKNFEIIVVDDNSNDNTLELLTSYDDQRLRVVSLDVNSGGPARPRNVGVANANGDLIAFCDADDLWHQNKLEYQLKCIECYDYDIVCTERVNFKNQNQVDLKSKLSGATYTVLKFSDFQFSCPIALSSVLLKRGLLADTHFNEAKTFHAVEDYELWLRLLNRCTAVRINLPLLFYRVHLAGISRSKVKQSIRVLRVFYHSFGLRRSLYHFAGYALTHVIRLLRYDHKRN